MNRPLTIKDIELIGNGLAYIVRTYPEHADHARNLIRELHSQYLPDNINTWLWQHDLAPVAKLMPRVDVLGWLLRIENKRGAEVLRIVSPNVGPGSMTVAPTDLPLANRLLFALGKELIVNTQPI